jgi:hypothetical protein
MSNPQDISETEARRIYSKGNVFVVMRGVGVYWHPSERKWWIKQLGIKPDVIGEATWEETVKKALKVKGH